MDPSPVRRGRLRPSPRTQFSQRFAELFEAAGNPTLRRVAAAAEARMRASRGPAHKGGATVQRISDWKAGRNVPAKFDSLLPVLLTLIDEARKSSHPVRPALLDAQEWQRLWAESNEWDPNSDTADVVCPYLGLAAYRAEDAEVFFGRTRPTAELAELVRGTTESGEGGMVILVGASGAGKSSLLQAGLIPALADPMQELAVASMTPGSDPVGALIAAVGSGEGRDKEKDELAEGGDSGGVGASGSSNEVAARDDVGEISDGRGLGRAGTTAKSLASALAAWGIGRRRLLVVDQLEELFTLCRDESQREVFLDALEHLAIRGETEPTAVVLAVRADFYARCLDEPALEDALKHRSYLLGPMRLDELAEALTRPAEMAGYKLESGLDELVITELCGIGGGGDRRSYDPGALPLVSHVMEAVWQRREGSRLTIDGYRAAGGVLGSVSATAENAWGELTGFQQAVGKQVLLGLVAVGGDSRDTRRRVSRAELLRQTVDAADTALDALARTRLITLDSETAYLTHEIVLDAWPRLRSWIDEDRVGNLERQRLQSDATEWVAHQHDPSVLYRGARLTTMREHARKGALGAVAQEFLTASETARQRAQRRSAVRRAALVLLTIVSVVLAGFAFLQSHNASQQRDNAVFDSVLAEADRLETSDPSLSAQLDLVAGRLRPGDPEVRARLINSEGMPLASALVGHQGYISSLAVRPDGRVLASGGSDCTIRLWDISDRRNPHPIGKLPSENGDQADRMTFSPDGSILAVSGTKSGVVLWDVRDPGHPTRFGNTVISSYGGVVKFSPDGKMLAVSDKNNALEFWNIADPQDAQLIGDPLSIPGHEEYYEIALSADLRRAVTVGVDDIQLWQIDASGEHATPAGRVADFGASVELSPDGTTLAVLTGGSVDLWDVKVPDNPQRAAGQISNVQNTLGSPFVFSKDGHEFVTVGFSGQIMAWDLADFSDHWIPSSAESPMGGAKGTIESVALSDDSRTIAAAGQDGIIRLWSMPSGVVGQSLRGRILGAYSNVIAVGNGSTTTEIWRIDNSKSAHIIGRIDDGLWRDSRGDLLDPVFRVVFSPDMRTVVLFRYSGDVQLFDISDPARARHLATIPVQANFNILSGVFSSDSAQLVLSGQLTGNNQDEDDGAIQVWNTADRLHPAPLSSRISTAGSGASDVQFDPGRRYLAAGGEDGTIKIWDMHDPARPINVAKMQTGQAENGIKIRFSADGKILTGTSVDDSLRVWDMEDPNNPRLIADPAAGDRAPIDALTAESVKLLVSTDDSGDVRLWDMTDPRRPESAHHPIISADTMQVGLMTFNPDGRHLIGTGADGMVRTWDLDTARAVVRICDITRGVLTPQVWRDQIPDLPYHPPCA